MSKNTKYFGLLFVCFTAFSLVAKAQTITGRFSVDNGYQLWIGNSYEVQTQLAAQWNTRAKQIKTGVSVTFNAIPDCHIYIVAWSDDKDFQGLVGSFSGATTIKTGDSQWRVWPTGNNLNGVSNATTTPSIGQVNSWLIGAPPNPSTWPIPFAGPIVNGPIPNNIYGTVLGIDPNAKWVWHDSKKDSRATWPLTTGTYSPHGVPFLGFNHDEVLIFRVPCPAPVQPPDPCCPPWNEHRLGDMLEYLGSGGIADPYTLNFAPTNAFDTQMQAYIDYLNVASNFAISSIHITFSLYDHGTGTSPSGASLAYIGPPGSQDRYVQWTAGPPGGYQMSPFFTMPSHSLQVGNWYRVGTGIWLNDNNSFFPDSCAVNEVFFRIQVLGLVAGGDGAAVLQIRMPDGRIVERPIEIRQEGRPQVVKQPAGRPQVIKQQDGKQQDGDSSTTKYTSSKRRCCRPGCDWNCGDKMLEVDKEHVENVRSQPPEGTQPAGRPHVVEQNGSWTPWYNRDNPSGKGDHELLSDFIAAGQARPNPVEIECQTTSGVGWRKAGQVYTCNTQTGGVCVNSQQRKGKCQDYKVRFRY